MCDISFGLDFIFTNFFKTLEEVREVEIKPERSITHLNLS